MDILTTTDIDALRVKVGRFSERFYVDPLPVDDIATADGTPRPSVTTVKKASGQDWSHVSLGRVAAVVAGAPNRWVGDHWGGGPWTRELIAVDMQTVNKAGLEAAGARGTAVHTIAQRILVDGKPPVLLDGELGADYLESTCAFFDRWQPEPVAVELAVFERRMHAIGYGGTLDAILRIAGRNYVVDWKSRGAGSVHAAYPHEAAQVAGYRHADYAITDIGGPLRRVALPQIDGGLIVTITPEGYAVHPVEMGKAYNHFVDLHAWWVSRRTERDTVGKPWDNDPPVLDEGVDMSGAEFGPTWETLQNHYAALDPAAKSWIVQLVNESLEAGVDFHARGRTARRFSLYRGLLALAEAGGDQPEGVRALVALALGNDSPLFESIALGHALGALNAKQADAFAHLADEHIAGVLTASRDDDGILRLTAA